MTRWLKDHGVDSLVHVPASADRLSAAQLAALVKAVERLPPPAPPSTTPAAVDLVPAQVAGFAPDPAV